MDSIIRPSRPLDEYGLPILPFPLPDQPDISEESMQRFIAGDFSDLNLPAPSSFPTPDEIRKESRQRSTDLLANWNLLKQTLERHEEVTQKRWMKKTKSARTAILTNAWPGIPPTHRPDFAALEKEGPQLKTQGTKLRGSYLWPYINLEDLVRGKTLLLFLNSRGRNPPHLFSNADWEVARLGHVSGAEMPAFLNLHSMWLTGESVETYGRLVSWDEDEDAMMKTMSGLVPQPGQGLMML